MPWCPSCKTEYREGFTACADCGTELTEIPPAPDAPRETGPAAFREPRLLATVADQVEVEMLRGLLKGAGIGTAVRDCHPAGSYLRSYMGKLTYGQQVFVDEEYLEEARELAAAFLPQVGHGGTPPAEPDGDGAEAEAAPDSFGWRRRATRVTILLFLVPSALLLLYGFWQVLANFFAAL